MSEQIREQISAFLDGELPNTESELLLKRLTRDPELRESFGRYALIGEAVRGTSRAYLSKGFPSRVNLAIDGEPVSAGANPPPRAAPRWWRPFAGVAVAAGVAAVAIVGIQHRSSAPGLRAGAALTAQNLTAQNLTTQNVSPVAQSLGASPREAISYTVPAASLGQPKILPAGRLTNYVFAHSRYSSGLDQRGVLADMLIEAEDQTQPAAAPTAP
jgi:negative regulator of sigma E activity